MSHALPDVLAWNLGTGVPRLLFKNRLLVHPSTVKHFPGSHSQVAQAHRGLLEQGNVPSKAPLALLYLVRDTAHGGGKIQQESMGPEATWGKTSLAYTGAQASPSIALLPSTAGKAILTAPCAY